MQSKHTRRLESGLYNSFKVFLYHLNEASKVSEHCLSTSTVCHSPDLQQPTTSSTVTPKRPECRKEALIREVNMGDEVPQELREVAHGWSVY